MNDPDFPDELRLFIAQSIPSIDVAELLVLLTASPCRDFTPEDVVQAMRPTSLSCSVVEKYLLDLQGHRIVSTDGPRFRYAPATPELDTLVRQLTRVYNERPVTLVRAIYTPRDDGIRSFADAFRIKT